MLTTMPAGCYSAALWRLLTLLLDGVALSKVVYNISASDSSITQTAFVGALFLVSVYRTQLFFVRSMDYMGKSSGHGFQFLLMKHFNTMGDGEGERLITS